MAEEEQELHPDLAAIFAAGDALLPDHEIGPKPTAQSATAPPPTPSNDRLELLEVLTGLSFHHPLTAVLLDTSVIYVPEACSTRECTGLPLNACGGARVRACVRTQAHIHTRNGTFCKYSYHTLLAVPSLLPLLLSLRMVPDGTRYRLLRCIYRAAQTWT